MNHIDGCKTNNNLTNLEWCTNGENQIHAYKNGLKRNLYGDKKGRAKYSNEQILEMCELMRTGHSTKFITDKFHIKDPELLSDIRNKRRWRKVSEGYTFSSGVLYGENNPATIYSDDDIKRICACLEQGMSQSEIYHHFDKKYSKSVIYRIKHRKIRRAITDQYKF